MQLLLFAFGSKRGLIVSLFICRASLQSFEKNELSLSRSFSLSIDLIHFEGAQLESNVLMQPTESRLDFLLNHSILPFQHALPSLCQVKL